MFRRALFILGILALVSSSLVYALEMEDDLSGFSEEASSDLDGFDNEEDEPSVKDDKRSDSKENLLHLSGNLAFKTSFGYKKHKVDGVDYSGFNQAKASLYLQLDKKLSDDWKIRISGEGSRAEGTLASFDLVFVSPTTPEKHLTESIRFFIFIALPSVFG